jgi:hypothetical protein
MPACELFSPAIVYKIVVADKLANDSQDVALNQDQILDAFNFDFGTCVLSEEHFVANFYFHGHASTFVVGAARSHRQYFALLGLFFGAIGKNYAPRCFFFSVEFLYDNSVGKRF